MPKSNLTTEQLSIMAMIEQWESADSDSRSKLWALAWRIGAIDSDKTRSAVRKEWVGRAKAVNQPSLAKAVNAAAKIIRLNGNKLPNKNVRTRIEKNAPTVVGQYAGRLNADILSTKGSNVSECIDPAKDRNKSTELVSAEAPTVENIGLLLGKCIVNATDADPEQLCRNVITIAMAYVADVKAKAQS